MDDLKFKTIPKVIFTGGLSVLMLASLAVGGVQIGFGIGFFTICLFLLTTRIGSLALNVCKLTEVKSYLPVAFVTGFIFLSVPLTILTAFCKVPILYSLALIALSTVFLSAKHYKVDHGSGSLFDSIVLLTFCIAILILSHIPLSSPVLLEKTNALPIWSDYFIHGTTIACFGSPFSLGSNMEVSGSNLGFYHFATYLIPAAFHHTFDINGLTLATSFLLPLGLIIGALGIYAFSVEIAGRSSGIIALTALICLPLYSFLIQSGMFDFPWILFSSPGTGYAVGISFVAFAALNRYFDNKSKLTLAFIVLTISSLILARAHFFLLVAPAIGALIVFYHYKTKVRLLVGASLGVVLTLTILLTFSKDLNSKWLELAKPHEYLSGVIGSSMLFQGKQILLPSGLFLKASVQVLIVLAATLGLYLFLYPLFFYFYSKRFKLQPIDFLPLLLTVVYVGLIFFSPTPKHGDFTEYKHRHFALLYLVFSIFTISYALRLASEFFRNHLAHHRPHFTNYFSITLSLCVLIATALLTWNSNPARPNTKAMPWAATFHDQPVTPGLVAASEFIKRNSKLGDVFALTYPALVNQATEVISLSGVPSYLGRPDLHKSVVGQEQKALIEGRLKKLEELSEIQNWLTAREFLRTNKIRWVLVSMDKPIAWDPTFSEVAFANQKMAVYDSGYTRD